MCKQIVFCLQPGTRNNNPGREMYQFQEPGVEKNEYLLFKTGDNDGEKMSGA